MHMFAWNSANYIFRCWKRWTNEGCIQIYLSQLRICIEQTFRIISTKWRILLQPLQVHLKNVGKYLCAFQDCIISALMRVVLLQSMQMKFKTMVLGLFHLLSIKQVLWEILCYRISQFKSCLSSNLKGHHLINLHKVIILSNLYLVCLIIWYFLIKV